MTEATKTVTIRLERRELVDLCRACTTLRENERERGETGERWDKLSVTLNKQLAKFDLDQ